ncbi:MAG: OmpA family protein [Polyangiaceae bacterium]|nr:OmpA family protein [Polyangiaceae bacterium]
MKSAQSSNLKASFLVASLAALLPACGAAAPSQELMDARRAYDEARQSTAATLVPDQLLNARQALEQAERAHDDDPQSFNEKSLAYIANRKAALSMAKASMVAAQREAQELDEAYKELQDKLRASAQKHAADTELTLREKQEALKRANEELADKGSKLSDAAKALAAQEAELKKRQAELEAKSTQLATTASELEREKAARLEAEKRAAEALASLKEIAKIKEEKRGMVITLEGAVLFTTGKATLIPIARTKLGQVAAVLKQQEDKKRITVEGHTDSVGSDQNNQRLSQERADSVREFLVSQGIDPQKITAIGKGEAEPVAENTTPEGRANNRRVEIIIN